jgi:hypothetical protein
MKLEVTMAPRQQLQHLQMSDAASELSLTKKKEKKGCQSSNRHPFLLDNLSSDWKECPNFKLPQNVFGIIRNFFWTPAVQFPPNTVLKRECLD